MLSLGVGSTDFRLEKAFFFDANTGYATGRHNSLNAVVVKTTDGGTTWSANTSFNERLNSISFGSNMNGIVVGKNGFWYKTLNAGNTWNLQPAFTNEDINDVHFINSTTILAVCDGGEIFKSIDGGNTWSLISTGTVEDLTSVNFLNANNGYVSATGGEILKTQDGGNTWIVLSTGVTFDIMDVQFLNVSNGYAVGLSTEVLHTTDGGTTWNSTSTTALSDIMSVNMLSSNLGYFVAHDGEVFIHQMNTSINIIENNVDVVVSPNPVTDMGVVKINNGLNEKWNIELFDILGNRIKQFNTIHTEQIVFSRTGMENGIYFYKVSGSTNQSYTGKFIIN
jgi:photosystem II stability/assembly factor-like uncharacterized protein